MGVIQIKMVSDNEVLDEVVIIGAGTQKKVSVTGSIASVKGTVLKAPSSSLTNNLAGKLSGVVAKRIVVNREQLPISIFVVSIRSVA